MTAGHFIYIPVCILIGIVFGWILGSRAARDAYLAELKRRDQRRRPVTGGEPPAGAGDAG